MPTKKPTLEKLFQKALGAKCKPACAHCKSKALGSKKPKMLGEHDAEILEGMARGPYVMEWANRKEEKGHSFRGGQDLYEIAPRTPSHAKKWAKELREKILNLNEAPSLTYLYEFAQSKGYKKEPSNFGFHLGMASIGHGVSWTDDCDGDYKDIKLPDTEFYY